MGTAPERGDILVVDDVPANLHLLSGMLRRQGYRVRPVPSGRLALQAVQAQLPDIVLLDVHMPEMNGYEVCRRLKEDPTSAGIPVLFISALSEPFDKLDAFESGGVDYITKPLHLDEVRVRVETHLSLRRLQVQLEQRNRQLETLNGQLREAEHTREMLTSAIVHDLKNPLTAILAGTKILLNSHGLDADAHELVEDLFTSADSMHRMTLVLLDVAMTPEPRLVARRADARLADLVAQASRTALLYARFSGHRVAAEASDPEGIVNVDAGLVVRTLENLLDNALKYAPSGTVVRLIARASKDGGLSARVEDSGRGIPPEYRERIFEREARLDRDVDVHARSSRGLGLAFCHLAVGAHGGRIWVEDNQPKGNVFCVELPGLGTGGADEGPGTSAP